MQRSVQIGARTFSFIAHWKLNNSHFSFIVTEKKNREYNSIFVHCNLSSFRKVCNVHKLSNESLIPSLDAFYCSKTLYVCMWMYVYERRRMRNSDAHTHTHTFKIPGQCKLTTGVNEWTKQPWMRTDPLLNVIGLVEQFELISLEMCLHFEMLNNFNDNERQFLKSN